MQRMQTANPFPDLNCLQPTHFCLAISLSLAMSDQAKHDVVNYEQAKPVHSDIVLIFTWKCALSKFASKFCPIFLNHKQLNILNYLFYVGWPCVFTG